MPEPIGPHARPPPLVEAGLRERIPSASRSRVSDSAAR